ncbi:FtsW/RodA/SpoVE family cell cycle protein [Kibdelosporangium phytohabitans]|uniref:Cell cycle protein n=1 Tax=Kibdelosporangium phytohabitans TaxID=860235 RepID=A0A0N9HUB2_9PSEU|nr:FtsW/RodA/SpoVE family cell cycle protein [Kibdelosporangium phytohabitans]ALG05550.1 cell cycle protein [Kibdelosporangium phytohabitans]MBE1466491.1 cell division protein FtsW (lipid II flippase) [Kibdelosporangium phytohabitans]
MAQPVPVGAGPATATGQGNHSNPAMQPVAPTRRGTELWMLAFAAALVTGALTLVSINQKQALTIQVLWYGLAFFAVFTIAHLAVRKLAPYADPLILPCVALLHGFGLVMIYRIDLAKSEKAIAQAKEYSAAAPKQVMWTVISLVLFLAVLWVVRNHRVLAKYGYTAGLVGLFALALPALLPASITEVNGAKVWLKLGIFNIQPGEFAKILLMVFFASFLVSKRDLFMVAGRRFLGLELPRARDLGPILVAWGVAIGVLVFEKDLGTSLLIFGIVLAMLYVATERAAWVVIGLTLFIGGALLAFSMFTHVQQRVANWLTPMDPDVYKRLGGSYQIAQGLFGIGTGGMAGTGLGAGRPDIVPEAHTDFITAAIGEELGFIGLAALLVVYMLLAMRGLRSAVAVRDSFGKLLGGGLSFAIVMQVFVVVGGVTALIPMTGITAPFLSYGGSSLLANYILIALLLRISDAARRPQTGSRPRPVQQAPLGEASTVMVERPT